MVGKQFWWAVGQNWFRANVLLAINSWLKPAEYSWKPLVYRIPSSGRPYRSMSGTSSLRVLPRYYLITWWLWRSRSIEMEPRYMEFGSVRLNLLTQRGTHSGNWEFRAVPKYDLSVYPVYPVIGARTVITSYNWSGHAAGYVFSEL